jgi:ribosomal protein L3 glutamine methyltransferase
LPFDWVDFEQGGHGVFVLTAQNLQAAQATGVL